MVGEARTTLTRNGLTRPDTFLATFRISLEGGLEMSVNRECVPLTSLLDSLLQKAYHDLTVLAEL